MDFFGVSELLTINLKVNPDTLWSKVISATCVHLQEQRAGRLFHYQDWILIAPPECEAQQSSSSTLL